MKTNMLQKLLSFLLLLAFTACETSTEEVPAPVLEEEPTCLLTEEVVESNFAYTIKHKINYAGPNNQITYFQNYFAEPATNEFVLAENFSLITYDNRGNIVKAEATGEYAGDIRAKHEFEYNATNQLTKWTYFSNFDGKLEEVYINVFEYASPTQLKKLTKSYPSSNAYDAGYHLYEYKNGLMHKVTHYEKDFATQTYRLSHTTQFEYDNMKHPKRKGYALHILSNAYLYGFPFQHNITKAITTVPDETIEYVDYTSTYTYNSEGFPLTQQKTENGFIRLNYTYTYACKSGD